MQCYLLNVQGIREVHVPALFMHSSLSIVTLQIVNQHQGQRVAGNSSLASIVDVMETCPVFDVQHQRTYPWVSYKDKQELPTDNRLFLAHCLNNYLSRSYQGLGLGQPGLTYAYDSIDNSVLCCFLILQLYLQNKTWISEKTIQKQPRYRLSQFPKPFKKQEGKKKVEYHTHAVIFQEMCVTDSHTIVDVEITLYISARLHITFV